MIMEDSSGKNFVTDWTQVPLPLADVKNNQPQVISDLTIPLPDIPALSIPDCPIVPPREFSSVIAPVESYGEEHSDGDEPEDEYMLMDNNDSIAPLISPGFVDSPSPFTSPPPPPPPPPLKETETTVVRNSYSPEPYETPLHLLPSHPSEALLAPSSPPILPPPSPPPFSPEQEASDSIRQVQVIPSSLHNIHVDDAQSSEGETYEDISSTSGNEEEDIMYEELNATNDDSDPSMYVDMLAEPVSYAGVEAVDDPTYDDIPAQAAPLQESPRVEILPSGQVRATIATTQGHGFMPGNPIPVVENEQGAPPVLTSFNGLIDDAPPSYNALFGAPSPPQPTQPLPQPQIPRAQQPSHIVIPSGAPAVTSVPATNMARSPTHNNRNENDQNWCLSAVNKSPLRTGIYLFIFLLGIFVPLGTLGLGIGLFLTTTEQDNTTSIYLIVIGSFSSFFVCWHTSALTIGAYIKAHNLPQRHSMSSCCMRLFHCGALFWWGAIGYLSYRIWPDVIAGNTTLDILTIVMLGFLTFQYLMTLYCCIETLVDCRGCLRDRLNRRDDGDF